MNPNPPLRIRIFYKETSETLGRGGGVDEYSPRIPVEQAHEWAENQIKQWNQDNPSELRELDKVRFFNSRGGWPKPPEPKR